MILVFFFPFLRSCFFPSFSFLSLSPPLFFYKYECIDSIWSNVHRATRRGLSAAAGATSTRRLHEEERARESKVVFPPRAKTHTHIENSFYRLVSSKCGERGEEYPCTAGETPEESRVLPRFKVATRMKLVNWARKRSKQRDRYTCIRGIFFLRCSSSSSSPCTSSSLTINVLDTIQKLRVSR